MRTRASAGLVVLCALSLSACSKEPRRAAPAPSASVAARLTPSAPPPQLLYLPDAAPAPSVTPAPTVMPAPILGSRCPPEMVDVKSTFCIDRFEDVLRDSSTGGSLSPFYHPTVDVTRAEFELWQRLRSEAPTAAGRLLPVPPPPEWQLSAQRLEPIATSVPDTVPNGYMSGEGASKACERAGKRLCSEEEWVVACRGEKNRRFPYGDVYEDGKCNVFRALHPARVLHGDPSQGHLDPRLNQVEDSGDPLLRRTGATPTCRSEWGQDAVYDMVGNLDEWIDDPDGTFLGGFYSRSTRDGCESKITVHPYQYYDYSLGVRCCKAQ
jgi:sulfatase modifying factor 1